MSAWRGHGRRSRSATPTPIRPWTDAAVARLGTALTDAGLRHVNQIYPGARHGFTMADTSVYDETATERHFSELRALFDAALR